MSRSNSAAAGENNADGQPKKWPGVTSPLNINGPTEHDKTLTSKLEACLRSFDLFESEEEMSHRMNVLSQVNEMVKAWVMSVSIAKKIPPEIAEKTSGKIFTFGSFRLGVHTKGNCNRF